MVDCVPSVDRSATGPARDSDWAKSDWMTVGNDCDSLIGVLVGGSGEPTASIASTAGSGGDRIGSADCKEKEL